MSEFLLGLQVTTSACEPWRKADLVWQKSLCKCGGANPQSSRAMKLNVTLARDLNGTQKNGPNATLEDQK